MKKIFSQNLVLWLLVFTASTFSLIFVQQQVLAVWQAPGASPGDNTPVSVPLTVDASNNVDVANNNLINVLDLRVDTLTATTSVNVLGTLTAVTLNPTNLSTDNLTMPLGSSQAILDVTGVDSSLDLTAANAVSIGVLTKAGKFSSGIAASGGISYGVYADTNASSGGLTNYAVAAVSNNAGGTAVYGLANAGWAGYFSGPIGVAGSAAFGNNSTANGLYGFAVGHSAVADGDYSLAFGAMTVSGADAVGINLDDLTAQTFAQANSMSIMGGNVGINTLTPSYKLHLIGSYYQDGMMQVRPTTVLGVGENIFYGNAPSGSDNASNLLLLQNNAVDKFSVTALGAGTFAGALSATQATFTSGLAVTGATTLTGALAIKSGGSISFSGSSGSYFDFNDDTGTGAPACAGGTAGVVYNFKVNNVLCYCNGTAWFSMVNGKADALCATK